jgi:Na+/glutamate symporter
MRERTSSVALWSGIMAGPAAWAIDLQLRYALVPWACAHGQMRPLTLISLPLLLVALIGGVISWRGLRMSDGDAVRIRFMALSGMALSLTFALTIVAMTIPDFFLRPCE